MKIKRSSVLIIVIIVILIAIPTAIKYFDINPFSKKIWDVNAEKLTSSFNVISGAAYIDDISCFIPFEWDEIYSFIPYTSKEKIQETIGYKWKYAFGTETEFSQNIIFLYKGKVVCRFIGSPGKNKIYFNFNSLKKAKLTPDDNLAFNYKVSESGLKTLYYVNNYITLDDIKKLALKDENLTWDDFSGFVYENTGSGLYIRYYPINKDYKLLIGGGSLKDKPLYIRLFNSINENLLVSRIIDN
jgi:hypothetical protein